MARRTVLTSRQRSALFALPQREADLLRHYTLSDEDLQNIGARRRPSNKLGFALQLCVLRYPGRLLAPGEFVPPAVVDFIGRAPTPVAVHQAPARPRTAIAAIGDATARGRAGSDADHLAPGSGAAAWRRRSATARGRACTDTDRHPIQNPGPAETGRGWRSDPPPPLGALDATSTAGGGNRDRSADVDRGGTARARAAAVGRVSGRRPAATLQRGRGRHVRRAGVPRRRLAEGRVPTRFVLKYTLRRRSEASAAHQAVEAGPGHAGDLGAGALGDAQLEEAADLRPWRFPPSLTPCFRRRRRSIWAPLLAPGRVATGWPGCWRASRRCSVTTTPSASAGRRCAIRTWSPCVRRFVGAAMRRSR